MSYVKDCYIDQGIKPEIAKFMLNAWRSGTRKNYGSHIAKWVAYCNKHSINFMQPRIGDILNWLYEGYVKGLAHSTLGSMRSALSTMISINNKPVGQHPYIVQFIRSVYQERPSLPKYNTTWSINKVMDYLKSLGPNSDLSLENLTKKLLMLMAILSGVRGQVLQFLDLDHMVLEKDHSRVAFAITKLTKTSKPGKHPSELVFKSYPHDEDLCVIKCLVEYIDRTDKIRHKDDQQLFITHGKPNRAAARGTIARWLKEVMLAAGINMGIFSSHSVRSASVSAVSTRLPLQTILRTGGWTSATTFSKYYNKPVVLEGTFQDAIMEQVARVN